MKNEYFNFSSFCSNNPLPNKREAVVRDLIDLSTFESLNTRNTKTDRIAADELRRIFTLDSSAVFDISNALLAGETIDPDSYADLLRALKIFSTYGVFEPEPTPSGSNINDLKFHARPLINMLKQMPHRDAKSGLSKQSCPDSLRRRNDFN